MATQTGEQSAEQTAFVYCPGPVGGDGDGDGDGGGGGEGGEAAAAASTRGIPLQDLSGAPLQEADYDDAAVEEDEALPPSADVVALPTGAEVVETRVERGKERDARKSSVADAP